MPRGSQERTNARMEEIVDACAQLYEKIPFKEITLGAIGAKTSFTRTSIYNYFHTKEEIFLALLEREYAAWTVDLNQLTESPLPPEAFPVRFAALLERRQPMLKLMSMNLYDMEAGSRLENLIAFKRVFYASMQAVERCLRRHFPHCTEKEIQEFLYTFFPFLFGVYPYTSHTEKQKEAMKLANVKYTELSIYEITRSFLIKILTSFR